MFFVYKITIHNVILFYTTAVRCVLSILILHCIQVALFVCFFQSTPFRYLRYFFQYLYRSNMATNYGSEEEVEDLTTCCICTETYGPSDEERKPKFLPCSHTFCQRCLKVSLSLLFSFTVN